MTLSLRLYAWGSALLLALLAAGRPAASGEALGLDWRRDLFGGIHSFIQRASIAPDRSLRVLESFEVCDYAAYPCTSGVVKSALAADLNGDGIDDLVTNTQILLNDGDFHFTPAVLLGARNTPDKVVLTDLDLDGNLDLVASGEDSQTHVILNDGGGFFQYGGALGDPPTGGSWILAAGDLDKDGLPDVVAGSWAFFGLGDRRFLGPFGLPNLFEKGESFSIGKVWIEDTDRAPQNELIVQGQLLPTAGPSVDGLTGLFVLRWNGTGFSDPEFREPAANAFVGLDLEDIDGDAILDKVETGWEGGPNYGVTSISWGRGGLQFEPGPTFQATGPLLAEDLDGDGLRDLAVGPLLFWSTGPRQYDPLPAVLPVLSGLFATGSFGARFLRGDSDRDGRLDVSDPIATLQHLFQERELACLDAADADDSGEVNLSDAIATLGFLFLGWTPPAGFARGSAIDLTPDSLGCTVRHGPIPESPAFFPPPWPNG